MSAPSRTFGPSANNTFLRRQAMNKHTVSVGLDVHTESVGIALADASVGGEFAALDRAARHFGGG